MFSFSTLLFLSSRSSEGPKPGEETSHRLSDVINENGIDWKIERDTETEKQKKNGRNKQKKRSFEVVFLFVLSALGIVYFSGNDEPPNLR